jgi:hypothetical protein
MCGCYFSILTILEGLYLQNMSAFTMLYDKQFSFLWPNYLKVLDVVRIDERSFCFDFNDFSRFSIQSYEIYKTCPPFVFCTIT